MISKKVILTGSFGVGKTSLFNQFIYHQFSDKYLTTIGVKVNKKTVTVDGEEISLLLWDIAGEVSQEKVPTSYFLGASAIIYVVDLTRPSTFVNMESDIDFLRKILPNGLVVVVANKKDLLAESQIEAAASHIPRQWDALTSAKTGEGVENMFLEMAKQLIELHTHG